MRKDSEEVEEIHYELELDIFTFFYVIIWTVHINERNNKNTTIETAKTLQNFFMFIQLEPNKHLIPNKTLVHGTKHIIFST